jgi:hypothetical protein
MEKKHAAKQAHYKYFKNFNFVDDLVDSDRLELMDVVALALFRDDLMQYVDHVFKSGNLRDASKVVKLFNMIYQGIDDFADDLERKKKVPKGLSLLRLHYPNLHFTKSELKQISEELDDAQHQLMMMESKLAKSTKTKKPRKYI